MSIKKLKSIIFIGSLILLGSLVGCKEKQIPLEVNLYERSLGERLEITAIVDEIIISNVEMNRGNCRGKGSTDITNNQGTIIEHVSKVMNKRRLKFGQKLYMTIYFCPIKEVTITTDQGDYVFTFKSI